MIAELILSIKQTIRNLDEMTQLTLERNDALIEESAAIEKAEKIEKYFVFGSMCFAAGGLTLILYLKIP